MKINYVFRTLSNYIGLSVFVFIGSMHFVQAQVESQLHPNELEFLENGISKANLRYSGIHLNIDNNETNGNVYMRAAADVRLDGLDDVIVEAFDDISLATNNLTRLFVNQSGDVGIGTTSPDADLEILELFDGRAELHITNSLSSFNAQSAILLNSTYNASTSELVIKNSDWAIVNEGDWDSGGFLGFYFDDDEFSAASDLKMRIRPSGDVWVDREMSAQCYETRGGCDIVEGFNSETMELEPGDVVIIDRENPGQVIKSVEGYDRKVLGIISGANGIQAGLKLSQEGVLEGKYPVAMAGQVYVKVFGKVQPGDLLTSSSVAGHAQAVTEFEKSHGCVIGKALSENDEGHGLVLVFVNLH